MRYTVYRYTPQYGNLHRQEWWLTSGSMGPYFGQTFSVNHPFFGETVWLIAFWKSHHFLKILWLERHWKDIWCNQEATGQGQIWRGLVPVIRFWSENLPVWAVSWQFSSVFIPCFFFARLPGDVLTISNSVVGSSYHKSSKKWDFIRCIVPAVRLMFGPVTVSGRY
jgi:hypothetical protein